MGKSAWCRRVGPNCFPQLKFGVGHGQLLTVQQRWWRDSPFRYRRTSWAAARAAILTVLTEAPAMCGVRVTLGSWSSGQSDGTGSTAKVSMAAPRKWFETSASYKAW